MDTDQLEHDMNELCHGWMSGKAPTDGVFGTVQAAARVLIFQALSAWTVLKETGQTEQLAPDFESWLRKILEDEIPYVRRVSSVKVSFPKHRPHRPRLITPPWPRARRRSLRSASPRRRRLRA
jgi:hypothetical protein